MSVDNEQRGPPARFGSTYTVSPELTPAAGLPSSKHRLCPGVLRDRGSYLDEAETTR